MTDEVFIERIFQRVLRRKADPQGKAAYIQALKEKHTTREQVVASLVESEEYDQILESSEFVPSGHFYSAVTSTEERERFVAEQPSLTRPTEIDFNDSRQWDLIESFKPFIEELPFPEKPNEASLYHLDNPAFGYADGIWLHSILRTFHPKNIIEVGCGYSSCMTIETVDKFLPKETTLKFIEPYPQFLENLTGERFKELNVVEQKLQDVPLDTFDILEHDDILFIDSSHVSKTGSDVNHAVFNVLPRLKPGVIIHFHDILWPFDYDPAWVEEGRCWNEAYLLRAFLAHNDSYEILLYPNSLYPENLTWFEENIPLALKVKGGSLWLRKVK
ncbi:class I SAM-dependent methyltransferase [Puniceicoccaceae bacterium K14]|nr:class I SAM-dependent methyltransferase [Puniceicoccaceae bacterium K14]